jgi:hypothetical protein
MRRATATMAVLAAASLTLGAAAKEAPVRIDSPDQKVVGPLNVATLNKFAGVALSGTPSKAGGFIYAFDRRLDTEYESKSPGDIHLDLAFRAPQTVHSIRLLFGEGRCQWALTAAESLTELEAGRGVQELVPLRDRLGPATWDEARLSPAKTVRVLRLTVKPANPREHVILRECNLLGEQTLEAVSVKSASNAIQQGRQTPLEVQGYFSGGDLRPITGKGLTWKVVPERAARVVQHNRILGTRLGPIQVTVQVNQFVSPPHFLEVVAAD